MSDCIAVVSGGMDSITLLYYLVKRKQRLRAFAEMGLEDSIA